MPVDFEPEAAIDFEPERPAVRLDDGSVATVRSIGVGDERGEWVIPTIVNGKPVSNDEAVSLWRAGKNKALGGPFKTVEEGNAFGQRFHEAEAARLGLSGGEIDFEPESKAIDPSRVKLSPYEKVESEHGKQDPYGAHDIEGLVPLAQALIPHIGERRTGAQTAADVSMLPLRAAALPFAAIPGLGAATEEVASDVGNFPAMLAYYMGKPYNPPFKPGEPIFGVPEGDTPIVNPNQSPELQAYVDEMTKQGAEMLTPGNVGFLLAAKALASKAGGLGKIDAADLQRALTENQIRKTPESAPVPELATRSVAPAGEAVAEAAPTKIDFVPEEATKEVGATETPPAADSEIVGMGGATPEEFGETGNPDAYGIAQRVREQRAKAGQVGDVPTGEGVSAKDSVERGQALLEIGEDPEAALTEFEKTKSVSADAVALTRAHGERLALAARRIEEQFGTDSPEYREAWKALTDWDTRTKPMQTEWHKIGMAQQGETDIDTGTFTGLQRAFKADTGKDFTPPQAHTAKQIAQRVKAAAGKASRIDAVFSDALKAELEASQNRTKAEQDARDAANKTVREAAVRAAAAEVKKLSVDAQRKKDVEKIMQKAELEARAAASKTVREAAIRRAKEEIKRINKAAELQKQIAEQERRAAQKRADEASKRIRDRVLRQNKSTLHDLANPEAPVWRKVKEYIDKGEANFDDIRNKVATDLGLSVKRVTDLILYRKRLKFLADDAWKQQQAYRRFQDQAKRWLKNTQTPLYLRALQSIPKALFSLKVGFHGTVALGTHAPMVAFQPRFWNAYVRNFAKMYRMVGSPAYYEMQVQDLLRKPNYITARRAGLVNDPFQFEDFNSPDTAKYFGNLTGMGNRGYAVLKMLRQDMFDQYWNKLPKTARIPEVAKAMADGINHSTGVVKMPAPKGAHVVLFAPRLAASRVAWLTVDPLKAVNTFARWGDATEAQKQFALMQVKEKAWVAGTMYGLLALNQGFLSATGSDQKVNMTDPMKSDFLKFKAAGMTASYGNAMVAMARLPARLYQIRQSDGGKLKNVVYPDESSYSVLGEYTRGQLSPFGSLASDLWLKSDWQNRPLPNSNRPTPRRLRAQGVKPYTWSEFAMEQAAPIPAEEAMREVWKGQGMNETQINHLLKVMAIIALDAGTGGRVVEDRDAKPRPTATTSRPRP